MESFNEVMNQRLEELNKLATETSNKKNSALSNKLKDDITKLISRLDKLELDHRDHLKKIHEKHNNHTIEVNQKTNNLSESINKISDRIVALESENDSLKKKLELILYTQEKLSEDLSHLKNKKINYEPSVSITKNIEEDSEKNISEKQVITLSNPNLGLNSDHLRKLRLSGKLEEEDPVNVEEIDKSVKKSFVNGLYQTWSGKNSKGTNLPEFTITLYGFKFKSGDSAKKQYKNLLAEAKNQDNHTQEPLSNVQEGWIFEKPTNTVLVAGKEYEITKAEAVFYVKNTAYDVNISFLNNKMSSSDLKTIATFLS